MVLFVKKLSQLAVFIAQINNLDRQTNRQTQVQTESGQTSNSQIFVTRSNANKPQMTPATENVGSEDPKVDAQHDHEAAGGDNNSDIKIATGTIKLTLKQRQLVAVMTRSTVLVSFMLTSTIVVGLINGFLSRAARQSSPETLLQLFEITLFSLIVDSTVNMFSLSI